ncbi:cytochrome c oxidase subunit 6A, mitochondrial-like isoform X2 [Tubulanus polymorphus]|uniref:cytochrome c oxidase subunit 6A, mitochondrial-like isoform X2 n=1 Tax=Tubulanus polymorphus TaxID=672921 RepID=UPI003DA49F75
MASQFLRLAGTRTNSAVRNYASAHGPSATAGGGKRWKMLSLLVAIPGVVLCWINSYQKEKEHHEHHVRPEFVAYSHLRLRSKAFPWGDGNHTLFHNKAVNALPEGYED